MVNSRKLERTRGSIYHPRASRRTASGRLVIRQNRTTMIPGNFSPHFELITKTSGGEVSSGSGEVKCAGAGYRGSVVSRPSSVMNIYGVMIACWFATLPTPSKKKIPRAHDANPPPCPVPPFDELSNWVSSASRQIEDGLPEASTRSPHSYRPRRAFASLEHLVWSLGERSTGGVNLGIVCAA